MKRIVYAIDVNFERGGAPISTRVLAEGISQYYECIVIKPFNEQEENLSKNISVTPVAIFNDELPYMLFHPIKWMSLCVEIERMIPSLNSKIIHAQMPNVAMAFGLLRSLGKLPNDIKLIYTDREHLGILKWIHRVRYKLFIAKNYDAIIALTDRSADYWKRITNVIVKRIYNTASPIFEHTELVATPNCDAQLRVILVGRVVEDKNWPLAIEIIKICHYVSYTLVFSFFDENQEKEFYEIIQPIKDYRNVRILTNLSLNELKECYNNSDILLVTSKKESFGRTAVEAMSQHCVVISTMVGGLPEVVAKDSNLVESTPLAFEHRLKEYDNNRVELERDKEYFYQRYKDNFTLEQNIESHLNLYRELDESNG